jgi:hypothetical protein
MLTPADWHQPYTTEKDFATDLAIKFGAHENRPRAASTDWDSVRREPASRLYSNLR